MGRRRGDLYELDDLVLAVVDGAACGDLRVALNGGGRKWDGTVVVVGASKAVEGQDVGHGEELVVGGWGGCCRLAGGEAAYLNGM